MTRDQERKGERGNAMIYILVAITLLVALTYTVMQGSRSSTQGLVEDRRHLLATDIIEYSESVKKAVTMLRLRGITVAQLEFDYPGAVGYDNPGCAAGTCNIFNPAGGAIIYKVADAEALATAQDWLFIGNNKIQRVGTNCATAACSEILIVLPDVTEAVCIELNDMLSVTNPSGIPPEDADIDTGTPYIGTLGADATIGDEAGSSALSGKTAGCFKETASGSYFFYQVLLPQ